MISILRKLYIGKLPSIVLMGHSLGGAVAVNLASLTEPNLPIIGLVVIDVVEGSAMESLASMQSFLRSRPKSFKSLEDAIAWGYVYKHIVLRFCQGALISYTKNVCIKIKFHLQVIQ